MHEVVLLSAPLKLDPEIVTGVHWTGSPNKSIDQLGKNCPKNVRKLCFQPLRTIFGHFRTFFRHFSDILSTFPFSGLSNDLPVTTLKGPESHVKWPPKKQQKKNKNAAAMRSRGVSPWGSRKGCPKEGQRSGPRGAQVVPQVVPQNRFQPLQKAQARMASSALF